MKLLILLRGLPGSGKSTLAQNLSPFIVAADDYFDRIHDGKFVPSEIKKAHQYCKDVCCSYMLFGDKNYPVVVHNTFTQEWEMEEYYKMAEEYGYMVHSVIVENRHGNESVHGVPEDKIKQMANRFEVQL